MSKLISSSKTENVTNDATLVAPTHIENLIHVIRGQQVILDKDLAMLYGVETFNLNKAVKRNAERFPEDFMFQLSQDEFENLKFQIGISRSQSFSDCYKQDENLICQIGISSWGGTRKLPYAFTENGVAMLSGVLRSEIAVKVNIEIMRAFVSMRRFLADNAQIFQKLEVIENHQLRLQEHVEVHDVKIDTVFKKLDEMNAQPEKGKIFYEGQIYDAHSFVCGLIKKAEKRIVVVDNYLDDTVLTRLAYRKPGVLVEIYTKNESKQLSLDVNLHNAQYPGVSVKISNKAHDRFMIIDDTVYHLGASIKDLGKKIFAFNQMEEEADELLKRL